MIIDNQTQNNNIKTIYDFIKKYSKTEGEFNIVTGYFTFKALATFFDELNFIKQYRIVIGDLTYEKPKDDKVINFLNPDLSIQTTFKLSHEAKKAVEFIKQEKVEIKTVRNKLCHAKTYIYKSPDNEDRDNFLIKFVMNDLQVSKPTATQYLNKLLKLGLLKKEKRWKTNYYINEQLYELFK